MGCWKETKRRGFGLHSLLPPSGRRVTPVIDGWVMTRIILGSFSCQSLKLRVNLQKFHVLFSFRALSLGLLAHSWERSFPLRPSPLLWLQCGINASPEPLSLPSSWRSSSCWRKEKGILNPRELERSGLNFPFNYHFQSPFSLPASTPVGFEGKDVLLSFHAQLDWSANSAIQGYRKEKSCREKNPLISLVTFSWR